MSVNRIKFLVIILIFMIPFIISYFLMDDYSGRWTLIYHLKNNCLDDCLKNIYLLRQIHTALGKDMNRLQRVLISNSESEIDILKSYPGLTIIKNNIL